MLESIATKALFFGLISAASLPLGSLAGMFWTPRDKVIAALMAFGGGALLSALTIDLVGNALRKGDFYPLAFGCILGGILFVVLNQLVNKKGGFLRKTATTISHIKRRKQKEYKRAFKKMSHVPLLHQLPPEEIHSLIPFISNISYKKGSRIIKQGDPGDSFFIVDRGEIDILDENNSSARIATLKSGDVFGEMAIITGAPRTATAVAATDTDIWLISKGNFEVLLRKSPKLAEPFKNLVKDRISDLQDRDFIAPEKADDWYSTAVKNIDKEISAPSQSEIIEAASSHGGAPLAIWLGILLDGIPESLVIGSSLIHTSISFSLIAGLFLSNFPEALSSSVGMREQKYSSQKIFWMWTSLMVLTGIGAFFGSIFFVGAPHYLFAVVEGVAAGAMLTMIAETMLPEAYHKGGAITGFATLLGFLAAIFFKTLESV